jgi:hypothetical protein
VRNYEASLEIVYAFVIVASYAGWQVCLRTGLASMSQDPLSTVPVSRGTQLLSSAAVLGVHLSVTS